MNPALEDPVWISFVLELEHLCETGDGDWRALRRNFKALRARLAPTKHAAAAEQELAFATFELAVNWDLDSRIVRKAFDLVWTDRFTAYARVFAAAHFWAWATSRSPADQARAEVVLVEARALTEQVTEPQQKLDLERMLESTVG